MGPLQGDLPKKLQDNKVSLAELCQVYTNLYLQHYEKLRVCFEVVNKEIVRNGFDKEYGQTEGVEDVVQITLDMLFGVSRDRKKLETCVYGDDGICLVTLMKRPDQQSGKKKA